MDDVSERCFVFGQSATIQNNILCGGDSFQNSQLSFEEIFFKVLVTCVDRIFVRDEKNVVRGNPVSLF